MKTIICLGDSFTRGFRVKPSENWISLLSDSPYSVINSGINGDTTSGMLSRFYPDVIAASSDYVLLTGGINDFIAGSGTEIPQNNYMALVHQAFSHNIIPIIGIAPGFVPDAARRDWAAFCDFHVVLEKHQAFRTWAHQFCQTFGLFSIDFYQEFEQIRQRYPQKNFYLDGVHLTPEGHRHIKEIAQSHFEAILGI